MKAPARVLRIPSKYAMYFDGINDYASIPRNRSLDLVAGNFSVGLWWVHPGRAGTWVGIVDQGRNAVRDFWVLTTVGGKGVSFGVGDGSTLIEISGPELPALVFHYITCVRRGRYLEIWVNGSRAITRELTITPALGTYPIELGRRSLDAHYSNQYLSCVQIYSRALNAEEVTWNYDNPGNPVKNGLVLWLQADPNNIKDVDGDGVLEWVDLSGFGNHGKIYGATLVGVVKSPARVLPPVR